MNAMNSDNELGIGRLLELRTEPAKGFERWGFERPTERCPADEANGPFESEREYRFCKAIVDKPLLPSSRYPKLAGISSKTALRVRRRLVSAGFVRERIVDTARRGPRTLLMEPLPAGQAAVKEHEAREE